MSLEDHLSIDHSHIGNMATDSDSSSPALMIPRDCFNQFSHEKRQEVTSTTIDSLDLHLPRKRQFDNFLKDIRAVVNYPINFSTFEDPVRTFEGATFERSAITKWLDENNNTCPISKKCITSRQLTPNHTMKELVNIISMNGIMESQVILGHFCNAK